MPRNSEITELQLRILQKAGQLAAREPQPGEHVAGLTQVGVELDRTRQQVVQALGRLEKTIQVAQHGADSAAEVDLVIETPAGLWVNKQAIDGANAVLRELDRFRRTAADQNRRYWLRVDGYWAHLGAFLAEAIGVLEQGPGGERVHVQLADDFGLGRSVKGSGLASRVAEGSIDLAVAPAGAPPASGVKSHPCHRVLLLAAMAPGHPLIDAADPVKRTVHVSELLSGRYPLLLSPPGHYSRDALQIHQAAVDQLEIQTGTEPFGLVALASSGERVAVVSSDSVLPAPQPDGDSQHTAQATAGSGWDIPDHWLAIEGLDGHLLGRDYSIYHRVHVPKVAGSNQSSVPPEVETLLSDLTRTARGLAEERLTARVRPWRRRSLSKSSRVVTRGMRIGYQ